MKRKVKIITGILICAFLTAGGVLWNNQKPSPYEEAYQRCLNSGFDSEKEELEKYCSCILSSPEGILNDALYREWLTYYGKNSKEGEEKFIQYDEINRRMSACFIENGPLSTWLNFGKKWCTEKLGENAEVCLCMFATVGESDGEDTVKNMIAIESGLISIPNETTENVKEREETLKELVEYCREHPFKTENQNS